MFNVNKWFARNVEAVSMVLLRENAEGNEEEEGIRRSGEDGGGDGVSTASGGPEGGDRSTNIDLGGREAQAPSESDSLLGGDAALKKKPKMNSTSALEHQRGRLGYMSMPEAGREGDEGDDSDYSSDEEFMSARPSTMSMLPTLQKATSINDPLKHERKHEATSWWKNWKGIKTHLPYYIPILVWLPNYSRHYLLNDLLSGLAISALLIPQAIAFANLATLPPEYGLSTAFFSTIIYAIMGSSRQLSIGPESSSAILISAIILGTTGDQTLKYVQVITMFTGVILLLMGIVRLGFIDNVLSKPLLCGYINAIALTVLIQQLQPILGLPSSADNRIYPIIKYLVQNSSKIAWKTAVVGISSILFLYIVKLLKYFIAKKAASYEIQARPSKFWSVFDAASKLFPEILLLIIITITLSYINDWSSFLDILGDIKEGFPSPSLPDFDGIEYDSALEGALIVGIIGFVESVCIAKLYANKYNYTVSPNRELIALGAVSFVGSFFSCFTAFGGLTRSAVADVTGAKTQLAGAVSGIIVLCTLFFLTPLFYYLPKVVLASIIVVAAIGLIELHELLLIWRIRSWSDLFMFFTTFFATLFLGVELGLLLSIGLSILLAIKHTSIPQISILGKNNLGRFKPLDSDSMVVPIPHILIVRIEEALYYANVAQVKEIITRIEQLGSQHAHPSSERCKSPFRAIIMDVKSIVSMDATAILTFQSMVKEYQKRGVRVIFVHLSSNLKFKLLQSGIIRSNDKTFSKIKEAVTWVTAALAIDDLTHKT